MESEKTSLLFSDKTAYGTLAAYYRSRKQPQVRTSGRGFFSLFSYARPFDVFLMMVGVLASCLHGACMPLMALVFGSMTNMFLNRAGNTFNDRNVTAAILKQLKIFGVDFNETTNPYNNGTTLNKDYDDSFFSGGETFKSKMLMFSTAYAIMGCFVFIVSFIQTYSWELTSYRQTDSLRKVFFRQVLRQDAAWFDKNEQGDLSSKLSDDLERVQEGIGNKLGLVVQYAATFIAGVVIGFFASWKLSLLILGACPIIIAVAAFASVCSSGNVAREQLKYAKAAAIVEQALSSIKTVAAFSGEKKEIKKYGDALEEGRMLAMCKYYVLAMGLFALYFVTYSSYGLAFWYGSILVSDNEATPGNIFAVFFSILAGAFALGNLFPFASSVGIALGSATTLYDIIDRYPTIDVYSTEGFIPRRIEGHISFSNVFFTYPSRPDVQVLKNLCFKVAAGKRIAIVGASGAGKSTVADLIQRFYDINQGRICIDGLNIKQYNLPWLRSQIGVVSQDAVLFGTTIYENIRYGFEEARKEDILRASNIANAHKFIADLPMGYETEVGPRGTMLSGGQKQRIAIARALVRDPKILLLDEATSALDTESEAVVQEALDRAMNGRTTVIIAHRLSTIKNADLIMAVEDGMIKESGTHEELMASEGVYCNLVLTQTLGIDSQPKIFPGPSTKSPSSCGGAGPSGSAWSIASSTFTDVEKPKSHLGQTWKELKKLMYLNMPEKGWLMLTVISSFFIGAVSPAFAFFYSQMFSTFLLEGEKLTKASLFWSSMLVLLGILSGTSFALMIVSTTTAAEKLLARLRLMVMSNILRQPVELFDQEEFSPGSILTKLSRDLPLIKSASGIRIGHCITALTTLGSAITIAFISGPKLASILIVTVPIIIVAACYQASLLRHRQIRDTQLMQKAGELASECIQNIKTVQSLGREEMFNYYYSKFLVLPLRENKIQAVYFGVFFGLSQAVIYFMYSAGFRYGTFLIESGDMTPSMVYRVFFALSFCASAVGHSAAYLQDFVKAREAVKLTFQLIEKKSAVDPLSHHGVKPRVEGRVEIKGVEFSYPSRPEIEVLRGINLEVRPGQTLALVGPSGSGKSTIVNLLLRFYQPSNGFITLDNIDVRAYNLKYLRSVMGLVSQEPVLFNMTIRENIAYGAVDDDVTLCEIINAAKIANIHGFISSLPLGYETVCGDRGTQLSGGQKQRIAIARAIIRNPKVLLLDEATSSLDSENEQIVQEALERARHGRTCIVIAHRLSTVKSADVIAVISRGTVVEIGTHRELIENKKQYYHLVMAQKFH